MCPIALLIRGILGLGYGPSNQATHILGGTVTALGSKKSDFALTHLRFTVTERRSKNTRVCSIPDAKWIGFSGEDFGRFITYCIITIRKLLPFVGIVALTVAATRLTS